MSQKNCPTLGSGKKSSFKMDFPELRQTYPWDCGPKALQSVLAYYGLDVREDRLIRATGADTSGTPARRLVSVARKYGLKAYIRSMTIARLKTVLDKRIPVILILQAWSPAKKTCWRKDWTDGHYAVAIGYDRRKIFFEDPASFQRTYLTYRQLESRWHDVDFDGQKYFHCGIVITGRRPSFRSNQSIPMG